MENDVDDLDDLDNSILMYHYPFKNYILNIIPKSLSAIAVLYRQTNLTNTTLTTNRQPL
jgi:hypothetical protein